MVQGLKSLERKLTRTIPARARKRTRAAMEKGATELVAMMKAFAPVHEGDLRDSIAWTWGDAPKGAMVLARSDATDGGERITVYAGNERTMVDGRSRRFQNAILQEFGTKDMPPSPYFFPSWRTLRRRIKSRITREMKKGIREGAK